MRRCCAWRRQDLKGGAAVRVDAGKHITGQTLAVDGGVSAVTGAKGSTNDRETLLQRRGRPRRQRVD